MGEQGSDNRTMRVLVFAPYADDSAILSERLPRDGLAVENLECGDAIGSLDETVGAVVLTQEALTDRCLDAVRDALLRQEAWSELPVVIIIDGKLQNMTVRDELNRRLPRAKIVLLSRPIKFVELDSVMRTMLRSRERQVSVGEHIEFQQTLQRELNHRVKNVLATVQGIYAMTVRRASDFDGFKEDFAGRLRALGSVHDLLYRVGADAPTLKSVAESARAPFDAEGKRIVMSGPDFEISSDAATMLALAFHELLTNAIKYGALRNETGRVELEWNFDESHDFIEFHWRETEGPPVDDPASSGYGSAFLRQVFGRNFEGAADLSFHETGLRAKLTAKTARLEK